MALPANWYFGGRSPQEGDQTSPFGGFNLGGVNDSPPVVSSVASPSPSAGVSGSGGMSIGQVGPAVTPTPQQPDASTPSTSTPDSNANVTGFNGDLASTGLTAATFGLPGIGSVVARLSARLPVPWPD